MGDDDDDKDAYIPELGLLSLQGLLHKVMEYMDANVAM